MTEIEALQNAIAAHRDEIERLTALVIEAEKYNGYHQLACLEIERLRTDYDILKGDFNSLLADYELVRRRPI